MSDPRRANLNVRNYERLTILASLIKIIVYADEKEVVNEFLRRSEQKDCDEIESESDESQEKKMIPTLSLMEMKTMMMITPMLTCRLALLLTTPLRLGLSRLEYMYMRPRNLVLKQVLLA
mmetsp:Transcript_13937/g.30980  ORF Transcript_13937/g.30980 Transcript_13937/m.30980 type:complete len:120 (+) Transcript_13937:477-836(+)